MTCRSLLMCLLMLTTTTRPVTGATEALTATVMPAACVSPCAAEVRWHLMTHPANSQLRIDLDSGEYAEYAEIPLTEASLASGRRVYQRLPAGLYTIRLILIRHDGGSYIAGRASVKLAVSE